MNKKGEASSRIYYYPLIITTFILSMIGLLVIYSASSMKGMHLFSDPYYFLRKQSLFIGFGFLLILAIRYISFQTLEKLVLASSLFSLTLLALIFIPGIYQKVGGAFRWIDFGISRFQPSELAKLATILFLAKNLSKEQCNLDRANPFVLTCALFPLLTGLCLLAQPDFGTFVIVVSISLLMFFVAGINLKYLWYSLAFFLISIVALIASKPYRIKRFFSFLNPWNDADGAGFQMIQSYLAFHNGGLLGVGLGESKQKLFFLPEAHNDFILAVIGEELGLLGVFLVCSLIFFVVRIGFLIAEQQTDSFRRLLAFGISAIIFIQALLNMCVVMGLLPTKGMTLPFVSSGASSLLISMAMIAILSKLAWDSPSN